MAPILAEIYLIALDSTITDSLDESASNSCLVRRHVGYIFICSFWNSDSYALEQFVEQQLRN